jgi:hypothetical protein
MMSFEECPFLEKSESMRASSEYQLFQQSTLRPKNWTMVPLTIIGVLSVLGNVLWIVHSIYGQPNSNTDGGLSLYAGLENDVPTPFRDDTLFSPRNRSLSDAAWDNWVVDPGIPRAQHWPWDGDKGVYLLNGFHNLHCLVSGLKV